MKQLLLICLLISSFGCAQKSKDFSLNSIDKDESVVIGNVKIAYNDDPINSSSCNVCFNSTNGPCVRLDESGDVFLALPPGPAKIAGISCLDTSLYHYEITNANFEVAGSGFKTYFGDVFIKWRTDGGLKATAFFGAIGAVADLSRNDGKIQMGVQDKSGRAIASFRKQVGKEHLRTIKNLVSVGN